MAKTNRLPEEDTTELDSNTSASAPTTPTTLTTPITPTIPSVPPSPPPSSPQPPKGDVDLVTSPPTWDNTSKMTTADGLDNDDAAISETDDKNEQSNTAVPSTSSAQDDKDNDEDDDDDDDELAPPDGGWGWMVVFSSFLIHVIADGIVYSFGVFLMEFVEVFDTGRGPASWIGALQPAVTFTVGPLASALTNRYGCRVVTVMGAIIAGIGFVISVFAPNLYYLYFSCGILAGIGFGLIYLPAIVSVAQYFEKKRSFATGLAVCGSGFGTFLLAPITEKLVHAYSWRGAMLILGGVIFNVIICGLLFRPLEATSSSKTKDEKANKKKKKGQQESDSDDNIGYGEKKTLLNSDRKMVAAPSTEMTIIKSECENDNRDDMGSSEMTFLIKKHHSTSPTVKGDGEGEGEKKSSLEIIPIASPTSTIAATAKTTGNGHNVNKNHQVKSAPSRVGCGGGGMSVPPLVITSDTDLLVSSIATDQESDGQGDISPISSPPSDVILNSFQVHVEFSPDMDENLRQVSASQCLTVSNGRKNGQDLASLAKSDGALHRRFVTTNKDEGASGGHNRTGGKSTPSSARRRIRQGSHSSVTSNPNTLTPLSRKDIFYSGSLLNIPMYRSQPDVYLATVTPVPPIRDSKPNGTDEADDVSGNKCFEFSREFRSTMREMMSFSLLRNPVFLMFGISNFLTSIGFNMPFIFLPDRAKVSGIDEDDAALLLSVIGIANTCGRIIFGFLSDRACINRLYLYNSALTICGLATALSPAAGDSYEIFILYAAVFGVFIGVYVSLTSVVLVDLLGLEYLTNSFGLLLLFQGAATFVGPPIAGMLYDWTGSYDISFIVMGTLIAISGAMLFLLPCIQRRYNRNVPVQYIIRDVEMGQQMQSSSEIAEIIHSREIPTTSRHKHS